MATWIWTATILLSTASSTAQGPASQQRQVDALEQKLVDRQLDAGSAARLAALLIDTSGGSAAERARRRIRVERAVAEFRANMHRIRRGGPFAPAELNSRWLKSRAEAQRPEARALFERVFLDQWALFYESGLQGHEARAFAALIEPEIRVNVRANASWLKSVLARIGWFDISRYGEDASMAAWLLVQHSDQEPEWQKAMLARLEAKVREGDMQPQYHAYLADRVASNAKQPQTYGTQGRCVGEEWQPFDLAAPETLDARRKAVGLEPFAAYKAQFKCP